MQESTKYRTSILTMLALITVLPFLSADLGATVYYVDTGHPAASNTNPGSATLPWKTLQKAASTLVAGDSVYVQNGVYNEQVNLANAGTAGNPIEFIAEQRHAAIIDGSGISLADYDGLVEIEGIRHIRFSGFTVRNSGPVGTASGIQVEGSSNIVVEHNHTFNTASSGIIAWNSQNITIDGNEVEQALSAGAISENECISLGETNGFEVMNNHVHHGSLIRGEGIDAKDGSLNGSIHDNHVHDVQGVGIYVDAWDKTTGDIQVYRNHVHDVGGSGMAAGSEQGGQLSNVYIYNNLIYNNDLLGVDLHSCCIASHPVDNVQVVNNTVVNNGVGWGGGIYVENTQATGIIIRNNIVSDNLSFQIFLEPPAAADITIDHNLIDGFTGGPGEVYGDYYQAGDPAFANPATADFHLTAGSPAIDHGAIQPEIDTDLDGNPRTAGASTDMGAFEFAQQPDWWRPPVVTLWQWQLDGTLNTSLVADMYDIDYEDTLAATVTGLHSGGRKAVCYISVGSWEDWRGDADDFPEIVKGNDYDGWPGEKWLDIRRIDLLGPILQARLDTCVSKGFDAVEPDNMDGYLNNTGFPLSYQDQLTFNLWLAAEAHRRGLSIGLKNTLDQVDHLLPYFDWALTEGCFHYNECAGYQPFIAAGKPVFAAEYTDNGTTLADFCSSAVTMGFRGILKNRDLGAPRQSCDGNTVYTNGNISIPAQVITTGNSLTWAATGWVTNAGNLTVNSGATLNLRGPEHRLNAGFRVLPGAWFRARR